MVTSCAALYSHEDISVHTGEIALVPPSLGLSTKLLNRDHHECYYAGR